MRILILSQYFWPESFRINALAESLAELGATVTVLTGQPNYPDGAVFAGYRALSVRREILESGIEVLRVPLVPRRNGSAVRLAANYASFVLSASVIGPWLLRGRSIDAILVYAPSPILQAIPGIVLKHLKRARLVTWVQDLWPESLVTTGFVQNRRVLAVVEHVVRWIYRRNDVLLGQSRAFLGAIRDKAGKTPVEYFPNPGEAPVDASADSSPALVLPHGFNVVFAGNLGTVQALETVLDAAELLRSDAEVRFVLVGSGSRSAWLVDQITQRKLANVMAPGRFPVTAMPAIFAQASVLLVSLNRSEILSQTIPAKVQTYLAAGRPVIASLDGEGAQLVTDAGAGFASPAEDAMALADRVLRIKRASADEQASMGAAGKRYYDAHFQPSVLADRLLTIFNEIRK